MKCFTFFILVLLTTSNIAQSNYTDEKAIETFQQLHHKLVSYEMMSYKFQRSINYFSENYQNEVSGDVILDFGGNDKSLGFKYQVENSEFKSVYNGSESFNLNKKDSTINVSYKAQLGHVQSLSAFTNSIVTLRKALPNIISSSDIEKKLSDTIINNKSFYLGTFTLQNKTLNNLGDFFPITLKRDFVYKVIIDKGTYLPLQVIQTNNVEPNDFVVTYFSEISADLSKQQENSWYYSTYLNNYKPAVENKTTLIQANVNAPNWEASSFDAANSISLNQLRGDVVLLEFWIKNCSNCIEAVPKLNAIRDKYKDQNLKVIGINKHDSPENIHFFYQKYKPKFTTVGDKDGAISKSYGINAFPTMVLIDKKGKILYAGEGLDEVLLETMIKKAIQ